MTSRFLLVVGDKFDAFTAGKAATTVSRFSLDLNNFAQRHDNYIYVVPGQGLTDHDFSALPDLVASSPVHNRIDWALWRSRAQRAGLHLSHKRHPQNSIISAPRRIADDVYTLDILVDENCEIMHDHQTGQHLQGMLLIEASRQSFLAVTEAFFIPEPGKRYYFVIHSMATKYQKFAFPIDARIVYRILSSNTNDPNKLSFTVSMGIEQAGETVATSDVSFTAFDEQRLLRREALAAQEALNTHFAMVSRNVHALPQSAA
jgi:hypothetical protein